MISNKLQKRRLNRWVKSQRIIKKDPEAKIIVSEDFNKIGMGQLKFLDNQGLTAFVPEDESSL